MKKQPFTMIVFNSTHAAIEASEILKNNKQVNRIVNTPGKIENGCGLSIYVNDTDIDKIQNPFKVFWMIKR